MEVQKIEKHVLKFWKNNDVFRKSLKARAKARDFVFYEGPPTTNGKGSVMQKILGGLAIAGTTVLLSSKGN